MNNALTHKLLTAAFILSLTAGCASVTDAGMQPEQQQPDVEQTTPTLTPDNVIGGSESEPIVDKPE